MKVLYEIKKIDSFNLCHTRNHKKNDEISTRFIQSLTAQILTQTWGKSTLLDRVEFTHAFFKLSVNTKRLCTKLFEELVSHYFSCLIMF